MTRQDLIIATIRTAVPGAIGYLLAQLIAAIPAVAGWIVTADEVLAVAAPGFTVVILVNAAAVGATIAAYYWFVRLLARRFPILEWLLGSAKTPSYANVQTLPDIAGLELAQRYGHQVGLTDLEIHDDYDAIANGPKHRA